MRHLLLILLASLPAVTAAADYELILRQALPANVVVQVDAVDGQRWGCWAHHFGYSNGLSDGIVRSLDRASGRLRMEVELIIAGDRWVPGGHRLSARIDAPEAGGMGAWTGTWRGAAAEGIAELRIKPPRRAVAGQDAEAAAEDRHPRILFTPARLPALQARLDTPFGRAWRARAQAEGDMVNLALLYALTGDAQALAGVRQQVDQQIADAGARMFTDDGGGSGAFGHRLAAVALAADLCHRGWGAEHHRRIEAALMANLPSAALHTMVTSHDNPHPASNYAGPSFGAAAVASLALDGPGPPIPQEKELPSITLPGRAASVSASAAAYAPGAWAGPWWWSGPVPGNRVSAPVMERIVPGDQVKILTHAADGIAEATATIAPVPAEAVASDGVQLGTLLSAGQSCLLLSAIDVAEGQVAELQLERNPARVAIDQVELRPSTWYRLAPGRHVVQVVQSGPGKVSLMLGGLATAEHEAIRRLRADIRARDAGLGIVGLHQRVADQLRRRVYQHLRMGIGDGGFQAETGGHYAEIGAWFPMLYACLHRLRFGRDVSGDPDATAFLARRLMQNIPIDGGVRPLAINGPAGLPARWMAIAMPLADAADVPALRWLWDRMAGAEADPAQIVAGKQLTGVALAMAFLTYPLDIPAAPPARRDWRADTFGFHLFRNGWKDRDDAVAQVFLKSAPVCGWNHPNAGTFLLTAFGRDWVWGSHDRIGFRDQEPVVQIPGIDLDLGSCGRLADRWAGPSGSGGLTVDLDDVYAAAGSRTWDKNLLRDAEHRKPAGISGWRSFGFDYGDRPGAPVVAVVADRIAGGPRRIWQWILPPGAIARTETTDRGFATTYDDAVMEVVMVHPAGAEAKIAADAVSLGRIGDRHRSFAGVIERATVAGDGDFLAVAVIRRATDPAPPVSWTGSGLDAAIQVGGRRFRVVDRRIVSAP